MKNILLLIVLVFTFSSLSAQQKLIGTLKKELLQVKTDTARIRLLSAMSFQYLFSRPDSALLLGQQVYEIAQKKQDLKGQALGLNRMALAYQLLGELPKSLQLLNKALKISEAINDKDGIIRAYNNMGDAFTSLKDYSSALNSYRKEKLAEGAAGDSTIRTLTAIGGTFLSLRQYDSASVYLKKALLISNKSKVYNSDYLRISLLLALGQLEEALNHPDKALKYYRASIFICEAKDDKLNLSNNFINLSRFYQQSQTDSSIFYAKKALFLSEEIGFNEGILEASTVLSELYENKNEKEALRFFKVATAAKDSLYSRDRLRQLLSISFDERLRQQEIEAARQESRSQMRLYYLIGILAVILFLAIVLYRNNKQKQKANVVLQRQKKEIENTLSKLKVTQTQLIQAEKMASLGELTAGIAHEIQNPLNFVNNFSEVSTELLQELEEELQKGDTVEALALAADVKGNLVKINHHGKRADSIVKGMLEHSRTTSGKKELTDINTLADEYLRLSYHGLRAKDKSFNASIVTDFAPNLNKVAVVPQDMGRVLLNLFNNAFYAVQQKSQLALAGEEAPPYQPQVMVSTKNLGNQIEIKIRDNGMGIPEIIKNKIFQPFFTTKPTGEGTGLGLSMSYEIVTKGHGGTISAQTEEGEYAEFNILLPA